MAGKPLPPLPTLPEIGTDGIRSVEYRCIQCKECGENSGEWERFVRAPLRHRDPDPWDLVHRGNTGHRRYWHHAYVRNHGEVW